MKKLLSFALLLGSLFLANVQGQVGFVYNGTTYQDGEEMTVALAADAHSIRGIKLQNLGIAALRDMVVTVTPVEEVGIEAWGVCAGGNCFARLNSNPFNMAPGYVDSAFSIDINVDNSVSDPHAVYSVNVSNGTVSCTVKMNVRVGTVGIDRAVAAATAVAYPNPSCGTVAISYELSQPATLAIVDMQGRAVRQLPVQGNGTAVVDDLPAGIYAYGILGSNSMKKLVVK